MSTGYLSYVLTSVAALAIAITVHESAHALAAYVLGDATARDRGRISFNPLAHIDPFGTVILPLIMLIAGGPIFAFAKPVPVYLGNLKHPKRDEVLVSLAGPVSNIALAALAALLIRLLAQSPIAVGVASFNLFGIVLDVLFTSISVNLSLAFFNLIPLPPLDGSSIIMPFLKGEALRTYYQVQRYAMPILIIVLYLLPSVLNIDVLGWYFDITAAPIAQLLLRFALGL